jgi:hypothetical protein
MHWVCGQDNIIVLKVLLYMAVELAPEISFGRDDCPGRQMKPF